MPPSLSFLLVVYLSSCSLWSLIGCLIVTNPVAVMDPLSGGLPVFPPLPSDRISATTVIQVAGLVLQVIIAGLVLQVKTVLLGSFFRSMRVAGLVLQVNTA